MYNNYVSHGGGGGSTPLTAPETEPESSYEYREPSPSEAFRLDSEHLSFGPLYPPNSLVINKNRNLQRQENLCEGESIEDGGAKNREIHISGYMRQRERLIFEDVLDSDHPFYLDTLGWHGEIRVDEGEYRGPLGIDPNTGEVLWTYTLDLVSTGRDEYENNHENGIIK